MEGPLPLHLSFFTSLALALLQSLTDRFQLYAVISAMAGIQTVNSNISNGAPLHFS